MKNNNILKAMPITRKCIAAYKYNGFWIELFQENDLVECWLRHPDYGIASFVKGVEISNDYIMDIGVINFFEDFIGREIETYIAYYIDECVQELQFE